MKGSRVLSLALGALLLCCGPADDAGEPPSGSTGRPAFPADRARGSAGDGGGEAPSARPGPTEGRVRAVFLGTSLTAGLGLLRDSERFTDRIQAMADSAAIPVEVVNAGVSGETSAGGLRRLDRLLEPPLDVLVVELGANDALRGLPVDAMRDNLREVVRVTRARRPDARIVLVGMEAPPNMGERYTSAFREAFRDVAREEGVQLVPFLLEGVGGVADLNQEDRIHPNAEGHRVIARLLWPTLEPVLREAARTKARGR